MRRSYKWALWLLTAAVAVAFCAYLWTTVMSRDVTAPVIRFDSDTVTVSVYDGDAALLEGVSAKDGRDGDVTASLLVEGVSTIRSDHSATVTYAAFDKAGNVVKATRTVVYQDYRAPRFSLTGALVYPGNTAPDVLLRVTASDLLDGELSERVKAELVSETTSINTVGTHQVRLRVTNNMGDTAYLTVPVEVYAAGTYNASVELTEYLIYVEKDTVISPEDYLDKLTVGKIEYDSASVWADGSVDIRSDVQTEQAGVYTVDYTVSMGAYTGFSRLIVVVED